MFDGMYSLLDKHHRVILSESVVGLHYHIIKARAYFMPIQIRNCFFFSLSQLSPDWQIDYESYDWRKLDPSSEECKTMVKEYFAWEGDFKHVGKAFNQGKVFK